MFHALESLVDGPTLARLSALAAAAEWQDGRATAGAAAASVKKNAQVPPASAQGRAIAEEVRAAILAHPVASRAALVRRFGPVLATRTGEGGGYGAHVDEATMRTAGRGRLTGPSAISPGRSGRGSRGIARGRRNHTRGKAGVSGRSWAGHRRGVARPGQAACGRRSAPGAEWFRFL